MKNQIFFWVLLIVFAGIVASCNSKPTDANAGSMYTELKVADIFACSKDSIAGSVATALHVSPVSFHTVVSTNDLPITTGVQWIKEGYQYTANDSGKITIWTDSAGLPYELTYEYRRRGIAPDWSIDRSEVDSLVISTLAAVGIASTGEAAYQSDQYAQASSHWYNISLHQKFNGTALSYPFIQCEVEGDTARINFLCFHRWYVNLNEIQRLKTDDELRSDAKRYFITSGITPPDSIRVLDMNIVKDELCKRLGSAIIDPYGVIVNLYIDIQNGNIVSVEHQYFR